MKIIFAGCGSAFTTEEYFQSNAIVQAPSGKRLLIDCGGDIRFALGRLGLGSKDIDAVFISHLHQDHIGGMEYLALTKFFTRKPDAPRPILFCVPELMEPLWECLRGGLETLETKVMNITDYFDCQPVPINSSFIWEEVRFTPVQTVHIMSGYKIMNSYGLMIKHCQPSVPPTRCKVIPFGADIQTQGRVAFFTTDTQFCPNQINKFYDLADIVFHDCETTPFRSSVHAHYDDLKTLRDDVKKKMWLYHYAPSPKQDPKADGFRGLVTRGQEFEIEERL